MSKNEGHQKPDRIIIYDHPMAVYQRNKDMLPESEFVPGQIAYLVAGNHCRLLDGRRTPGVIEAYFPESAMFRWRILDFEDKGKFWDVPAEDATRYQFAKGAKTIDHNAVLAVLEATNKYRTNVSPEELAKVHISEDLATEIAQLAKDYILIHQGG